jgi:hypothetical protein
LLERSVEVRQRLSRRARAYSPRSGLDLAIGLLRENNCRATNPAGAAYRSSPA